MTEFERKGRKTRRHIYVSREFDGAADALLPDHRNFSRWAERVLWRELLREYGEEDVEEAVEDAQNDMDADDVLPEDARESYELTA